MSQSLTVQQSISCNYVIRPDKYVLTDLGAKCITPSLKLCPHSLIQCVAARHPAVDIAASFICQPVGSIWCCCVVPLCLLIPRSAVLDGLKDILMRDQFSQTPADVHRRVLYRWQTTSPRENSVFWEVFGLFTAESFSCISFLFVRFDGASLQIATRQAFNHTGFIHPQHSRLITSLIN